LESDVSEAFLEGRELAGALRIEGESPLAAARSAAVAVRGAPTLVLSAGAVVSPDWLPRAFEAFAEKDHQALVYPEVGMFHDHGVLEVVSYARPSLYATAASRV